MAPFVSVCGGAIGKNFNRTPNLTLTLTLTRTLTLQTPTPPTLTPTLRGNPNIHISHTICPMVPLAQVTRGHSPALLASGPPHPNPAGKCNQSESSSGGSSYRHRTVHDAHIAPHNAALDAIPFKCGGMFVLVVQSLTTGSLPGECHSQCMFFQKAA